jgi:uncharacterized protein
MLSKEHLGNNTIFPRNVNQRKRDTGYFSCLNRESGCQQKYAYAILIPMKKVKRSTKAKKVPTVAQLRSKVLRVTKKHGATNVRIFGSFARGEQHSRSDVDLLVDLPDHMSLLGLSGLKVDLEETLNRKVDVVPSDSIKPALRKYILADARPL